MAISKNAKRTIQVYIDNKSIDGSVSSIRNRIRELTTEIKKMTVGTEEYEKKAKELRDLNGILKEHGANIGRVTKEYAGLYGRFQKIIDTGIGAFLGSIMASFKNKLADFLSTSISAYQVQEEAERKLETVMRERMVATDDEIQQMKDLACEQQKLGVIGDEVQLAGMQQVSTFLKEKDSLAILVPAMNDLIAQQKGLNATQQDAQSIGNLFGKVMQGQTSALKRAGITFSEAQEQIMKTGNEQERAAMLAQVVTENVGHMNAELAKTDAGKAKQAANELGDLSEKVGRKLISIKAIAEQAFSVAVKGAMNAVKWLTSHWRVIVMVASAWAIYKASVNRALILTKIKAAIDATTKAIKTLGTAIKSNPWGLIATAAALAIGWIWDSISAVKEHTKQVNAASKIAEAWRDVQNDAAKTAATQKQKIEELTRIVADNTVALNTRYAAAKKLESIVPGYVASLNAEKGALNSNSKAIENYIARLDRLALARAVYKKLEELAAKAIDADMAVATWEKAVQRREGIIRGLERNVDDYYNRNANVFSYEKAHGLDTRAEGELRRSHEMQRYNKERLGYWQSEQHAIVETRKALHQYLDERVSKEDQLAAMDDSAWDTSPINIGGGSSSGKGGKGGRTSTGKGGHQETEEEKLKRELKEKLEAIELKSQQRLQALKERFYKGDIKSEEEYNLERNRIERAAVEEALALMAMEPKERQKLLEKLLELQMQFGEQYAALRDKETEEDRKRLEKRNADFTKFTEEWKAKEEERAKHAIEKNQEMAATISDITKQLGTSMGQFLAGMFKGEKEAWKDFLRDIITTFIDYLEKMVLAYYAAILGKEIASKGWLGVPSAAGQMALITAAFEAAKALAQSFDSGGFTGTGAWNEPKGIVHANEFVANRFATANKHVQPVLSLIDAAQRSGSVSRLTSADVAAVLPYSTETRSTVNGARRTGMVRSRDDDRVMMAILSKVNATVDKLNGRLDKPIYAETYITGKGGIENAQSLYDRMKNNVRRRS